MERRSFQEEWEKKYATDWGRRRLSRVRIFFGHTAMRLRDTLPPGLRCFTFLRAPLARVVSLFHYARDANRDAGALGRILQEEDWTLERIYNEGPTALHRDFVRYGPMRQFFNGQARSLLVGYNDPQHFPSEPRHPLLRDRQRQAAALLDEFEFVGRQEKFAEDLRSLAQIFGWSLPFTPRKNVATQPAIAEDLNFELRQLILAHNEVDQALVASAEATHQARESHSSKDGRRPPAIPSRGEL